MVDGRSSAGDLMATKPKLPEVARSLEQLRREGFIEPLGADFMPSAPTETADPDPLPVTPVDADAALRQDDSAAVAKWVRRGMFLLPVALLAAAVFLGYRSLDDLRARVEATLGKRAGGLSSTEVTFSFRPWPVLTFSNVAIGKTFKAQELVVHPAFRQLLGRPGPISHLEFQVATLAGPDLLGALVGPGLAQAAGPPLAERITLNASELRLGSLALSPLAADLRYGSDGKLERAVLAVEERRARMVVKGRDGELTFEFAASNWSTPTDPPLSFRQLDASGLLDGERIVLSRVEGVLYDGLIKGGLTLDWRPSLAAEGRFSVTNIELQGLIAAFTGDFSVGGRLDAEGEFGARASSFEGLLREVNVDATFHLKRGVVHDADIVTAVRDDSTGGATQFDDLRGTLQTAGRAFSFREIELASGTVKATGTLDVTASRQLLGRFLVKPLTASQRGGTVVVGGSLKAPTLRPGG
jgi:hypothetical protein